MIATAFVDTNVLIYAATGRLSEPSKCALARDLVATKKLGLSGQVIAEFVANVRNAAKMRRPLSFEETIAWVDRLQAFPFVEVDRSLVRAGMVLAEQHRISYWDGAILAAAERLGAPILYTEDLSHERTYGSVQVINPFLTA